MVRNVHIAVTLVAGLAAFAATGTTPAAERADGTPTAEEVVARNVVARGGLDAWRAVQSLRMRGFMDLGQGVQAPFTLQLKRPRKMRLELLFDGQMLVQAFDGQTGWKREPQLGRGGYALMSEEELQRTAAQAELEGPLIDYREKGHQVSLAGQETVEDRPVYEVVVTLATGAVRHLYLDAETFLEVKVDGSRPLRGEERALETFFRDYRDVGGLAVPFTLETKVEGAPGSQKVVIEAVELNPPLADTLFAPPSS